MPPKNAAFNALFELSSIGIHLVVSTFVGGGFGYFLDKKVFGTFPWMSMIFLILGIAAGFLKIYQLAKAAQENDEAGSDRTDS